MSVLDICLADPLHLLLLVAILNISLYLVPCLAFDSFWYKLCCALDLGVLLKSAVETGIGPTDGHWPQDAGTNLFITVCFTLFFYVMAANIWGCVFLVVGLLSVGPFWDSVYSEMQLFASNSLDIIIDETNVSWVKALVCFVVLLIVAVWVFFSIPMVRVLTMCITTAVKLVMALKVIWIVIIQGDEVCCAANTDADYCPFWLSKMMWVLADTAYKPSSELQLLGKTSRLSAGSYRQDRCEAEVCCCGCKCILR
jgi:hypothetical protein